MKPWRLTVPGGLYAELQRHLFPGDGDEHGAVILAGTCESARGLKLVAREIHLEKDAVDYVPGKHGYRMLKAEFIQSRILRAREAASQTAAVRPRQVRVREVRIHVRIRVLEGDLEANPQSSACT